MKKLTCVFLSLIIFLQVAPFSFAINDNELLFLEYNLLENNEIMQYKNLGLLDKFIETLYIEYNTQREENQIQIYSLLDEWGLDSNITIEELKDKASVYVNNNLNFTIDSDAFYDYTKKMLSDDSFGVCYLAENDSEFGPLYLYMCLYNELQLNNEYSTRLRNNYDIEEITLFELFEFDFNYNFIETQLPIIIYNFSEANLTSDGNVWPSLNGNLIQSYAQLWSLPGNETYHNPNYIFVSDGGDCTNFASQALYAGGLPMTSYVGEENNSGYTDTNTRWFYFTNSSTVGYSISTSWVRVVDLYNYLSPHYGCGERLANTDMNPYLNKGFLLQGKHLIGSYSHSVIITMINNTPFYCAHSNQRKNESMSTFYNEYYKCRVVQVY